MSHPQYKLSSILRRRKDHIGFESYRFQKEIYSVVPFCHIPSTTSNLDWKDLTTSTILFELPGTHYLSAENIEYSTIYPYLEAINRVLRLSTVFPYLIVEPVDSYTYPGGHDKALGHIAVHAAVALYNRFKLRKGAMEARGKDLSVKGINDPAFYILVFTPHK